MFHLTACCVRRLWGETWVRVPSIPLSGRTGRVDLLRSAAAISSRISVFGHVYDVATGLVETVIAAAPATGSA